MNFPSIDIQGSILSADLLGKIRSEQSTFQQGKDFNPVYTNAKLKDEISLAWQDAKGQWTIFQNKLKRVGEGETASTETRSFWILPLLSNFGYDFQYLKSAEELNGKSFWINNRDNNIGGFPLYIAGYNESLDRRSENKTLRVSPHALVQEYLNYSEHLYGLVTNGKLLRLLRDASRLTRLSYLEFNLEKIMEEDLYSDFVILYRLLHVSRMPQLQEGDVISIVEKYHLEGLEAGATIRSKLGDAVKQSILSLANGFVNHPDNVQFRQTISGNHFNTDEFYRQQLRIVYRLLFLFVIEERNLVYSESKDPDIRRFSQIYYNHFSLQRIRKLAKRLPPPEASRHYDLWMGLVNTFALFEDQQIGAKMGIMALQGELFSYDAITASAYDLHQCRLSNEVLLRVIKALGYFENDKQLLIAVNYGGLDVEEFGSVYEGLLELKLKIESVVGTNIFSCSYAGSEERSKSGSHYSPDELVQPLIKHSLDYLLADRKKIIMDIITRQRFFGPDFRSKRQELVMQYIYSLKVCDVACGSGHLLISGARRIAEVAACIIEEEEQPNPKAFQLAKRNAILNCIYGVDKNPLAVELCKVALWLEAYVPGQPLNFLDHHIKCGDSIVGLAHREELENGIADEAFKTLPGDDKEIAAAFLKKNKQESRIRKDKEIGTQFKLTNTIDNTVQESMAEYRTFNQLPERTPNEIAAKARAYRKFTNGKGYNFLKVMADTQVAQFFIPKTTANKDRLITDSDFMTILKGFGGWQNQQTSYAVVVAQEKRFFHWFLEFPEVFQNGGFDCILGNPPYLGGSKISSNYGDYYFNYLLSNNNNLSGISDLITYFLRRIYLVLSKLGFCSLISTNSISEGDTRESGLEYILRENPRTEINFASKSVKWPGTANVFVSLFSMAKDNNLYKLNRILNSNIVKHISSFLLDEQELLKPFSLKSNSNLLFQGSKFLGDGFLLNNEEREILISSDSRNEKVIQKVLNGKDVNDIYSQKSQRWIINFYDWSIETASLYTLPFQRIVTYVKPVREKDKRQSRKEKWWIYAERSPSLYESLKSNKKCIVTAVTTKHLCFSIVESDQVFTEALFVHIKNSFLDFLFLQSSIHNEWVRKYATSLETRLRYGNADCFETFPFPQNLSPKLDHIGETYHEHRRQLMLSMQLGLTKTYNAFHAKEIKPGITASALQNQDKKAIEKQYGKEVWNLWNHLQKSQETCTIEEAITGIIQLRELHVQMDNAVLEAYGWAPSTGSVGGATAGVIGAPIHLRHDFYEVDYLPENDRIRYTIHPEARKEILKRLLELNHQIHEEEVKKGLWDKKKAGKKEYPTKGFDVGDVVKEDEGGYGQGKLF